MEQAFIREIERQRIKLTVEQEQTLLDDFKLYCEEMEFTKEEYIVAGALEYITCQIQYGIIGY